MASAEELSESEVLWPEAPHGDDAPPSCSTSSPSVAPARRGVPGWPIHHPGSRPVDIPRPDPARRRADGDEDGGWSCSGSGTMVPPHVLVSRRRSSEGVAAFALRSGPGRDRPRARELSHLRNSVLRMTGYIEG